MNSSAHHRPSDSEAIEATAAAWLAERDDRLTPAREMEFARWRGSDPRHEAAVVRLECMWAALQTLRDFRPEAARHPDRDLLRARTARRGRVMPFPALVGAAVLAACVAIAAVWTFGARHSVAPGEQRYATTVDGYERVALEDGSLLELNANSEVRVQFTLAERRAQLVRGEAHFTVAKHKARPFLVDAGAVAVRAIGTAFNVRLGTSDVEVLVTEGKVQVGRWEERVVPNALTASTGEKMRWRERVPPAITELAANERAIVPTPPPVARANAGSTLLAVPVIEKISSEAVREALAWQGPRLVFVDTPLADAVAQFNRRNHVQLELPDAELGALPIGGSFRAENVDAFVRLLASGGDVAVERPASHRIVLRKAGPARQPD